MRSTTINTITALWGMARPLILLSVILVYFNGSLIARVLDQHWSLPHFIWGLIALLFAAISIHYVNEYADYQTDALTTPTAFSGGSGVLPSGQVNRRVALQAAWITLGICGIVAVMGLIGGIGNGLVLLVLLIGISLARLGRGR